MRTLPFVAVAILLSACASTETQPTARFEKPIEGSNAIVYVFRSQSMPTRANVKVEVNGKLTALLPDNSFTWVAVEPGRKSLRVGYPSFPDMSKTVEVDLQAGKSYLVQYRGSSGGPDRPVFGSGGNFIGTIRVGQQAWTNVEVLPSDGVPKVTSTFPYVPAKP